MADPDVIYLEPDPGPSDDRTWCVNDVWPEEYGQGPSGIKYVRADLHEAALKAARAEAAAACTAWLLQRCGKRVDVAMSVGMQMVVLDGS